MHRQQMSSEDGQPATGVSLLRRACVRPVFSGRFSLATACVALLAAVLSLWPFRSVLPQAGDAQAPATVRDQRQRSDDPPMSSADRGAYLVHQVAMCVICHSPRDSSGQVDNDRLLMGGRIPVESPYAGLEWAFRAPRLAGLPGWQKEELVTLLHTGQSPQGFVPRPPMPPFRMTREDAQAVADYLSEFRP